MEATRLEHLQIPVYRFNHQGLEVFVAETGKRGCLAQICVRAGSLLDGRYPGRAHFIEHLKIQGTGRDGIHPRLRKLILGGAERNASTNLFRTEYHVDCLTENMSEMVQAVVPLCLGDEVSPEFMELERGVVIQEARQKELQAEIELELNRQVLPDQRELHYGTLGTKASLRAVTHDALMAFTDSYYTADNAALFVAGGVSWQSVAEALEEVVVKAVKGETPKLPEPKLKIARASFERESFNDVASIYFEGTQDKDDLLKLGIAGALLAKPPLGLLYARLRLKDRSAYSIFFMNDGFLRLVGVRVPTTPQKFNLVEESFFHEVGRLAELDYPQEVFDFVMADKRVESELKKSGGRSNEGWVNFLRTSWLDDDYTDDYLERALRVTREDVAEVVRKYFRRDRYGCLHFFKKRDW